MKHLPVHIIIVFLLLTACSSDPIADAPIRNEVKFNTGVVFTRGIIDSDENHIPQQAMNGIQLLRGTDGSTRQGFITSIVASTASVSAGNGTMTLATRQYFDEYNNDAHFMAFYPVPNNYEAGKASWTIDGTQDILVTKPITASHQGSRNVTFEFEHLLSQVVLQLVAIDEPTTDLYGNLLSAKINIPTELDMTIADNGDTSLDKKSNSAKINYDFGPMELKTDTVTSSGILIYPDAGDLAHITLEFAKFAAADYPIENLVLAPGYKTFIVATVKGKAINFNVTLQSWKNVTENEGQDDEIGLGKPGEPLK